MKNTKNPIHLRELIIALGVILTIFVLGAIFDFEFSKTVFASSKDNPSLYGIIFSGIAELPVTACLCIGGFMQIRGRVKEEKFGPKEFLCWFFGIVAIGAGAYYVYDTFTDLAGFPGLYEHEKLIKVLGIAFALLFVVGTGAYVFFRLKNASKEQMLDLGNILVFSSLIVAVAGTGAKYLWSRPRPRYIFSAQGDASSLFKNFYELNPFYALTHKNVDGIYFEPYGEDAFRSFPSGHSMYSGLGMFLLPYLTLLTKENKENRTLQISLFYVGLAWGLISALSRVFAGAHFLTDISAGLLITLVLGGATNIIGYKLVEKRASKEVKEIAD